MSASSAPTVKAAVIALLQGASVLTGVTITYAHPGVAIQQEAIYFTSTALTEDAVLLGRNRRTEDYDLTLIVDVALDGDDAQTCEERGWAVVGGVETTLRTQTDASGTINGGWLLVRSINSELYMHQGGWLYEAKVVLHVKNHK